MSNERLYEIANKAADEIVVLNVTSRIAIRAAVDAVAAAVRADCEQDAKRWKFCRDNDSFPAISGFGAKWAMFLWSRPVPIPSFHGIDPDVIVDAALANKDQPK